MQFQEYAYQHMDALSLQKQLSELAEQIQQAKTIEQVQDCIKKVDTIRRFVATQVSLVEIRHTVDTKDAYYTKEQEYLDTVLPELEKDYEKMVDIFKKHDIKYVLLNGGNGTMDACGHIYEVCKDQDIKVVGIPKTIDNDIALSLIHI